MKPEEAFTFCRKNLKSDTFVALENMKRNEEFCDITLKVQDVCIKAHRAVLAASIPYFQKTLGSCAHVSKSSEITFVGEDLVAVESLISFAYTGQVRITQENALPLLSTSDFFELEDVLRSCIEYLSSRLSPRNVLHVREKCLQYGIQDVLDKTDRYVIDNFEHIFDTGSFPNLEFTYLKKILHRDDLCISVEKTVYEAIIQWVKAAPDTEQNSLPELLQAVRMRQLSDDYLTKKVMTEEMILKSDGCKKLLFGNKDCSSQAKNIQFRNFTARPRTSTIREERRLQTNPDHHGLFMINYSDSDPHSVSRPRSSTIEEEQRLQTNPGHHGLFMINYSDSEPHSVYKYDLQNYEWTCIGSNNLSNQCAKIYRAVATHDKICMLLKRSIQIFHVKTHKWSMLKPLDYPVAGSGICFHNDKIYFFGGVSEKTRCFDLQAKKWLDDGMMKEHRTDCGAAPLGRFIFVTGGHSKGSALNSVEMYNPWTGKSSMKVDSLSSEKCRKISCMLSARYGHGCAALNEKIYVCGGSQGKYSFLEANESDPEITSTVEVYDPVTNEWKFISSLYTPRTFLSFVSCGQKLYAAGGRTQYGRSTFHVEVYDTQLDIWDFCPQIPNYGINKTYVKLVDISPKYGK